ncbi:MAG: ion transporter [Bacteroidaceae bacterium]|nr:ion transporter [Bacteroidaceae bacterium]
MKNKAKAKAKKTLEKMNNVVEPENYNIIAQLYDVIMIIAIFIGVIPLMFRTQTTLFWWFDLISCICFIIDYLIRWSTYGIRSKKNDWFNYITYPLTPMAIIDLLSILPTINLLAPTFKLARFSRLLRLLRIVKIIHYFESLEIIIEVIKKQKKVLLTVLTLAIFYTFITALIMFNGEEEINPSTGKYLFDDFFDAFYWAACTLTTVGYGDLYPISDTGRFISIVSSFVGIAIIALPSGVITAGYLDELRKRETALNNNHENQIDNSFSKYPSKR